MPSPKKRKANPYRLPAELAGEQIIALDDAEDVAGVSRETIERTMAHHIIHLSGRRKGIRLKHVLRLA